HTSSKTNRGNVMRRRHASLAATAIPFVLLVGLIAADEPAKKPLPDAKAQAKVEALLQELFKDDLASAEKDPAVRARLAATFLHEGRETDDDRAGRFVLFRKARDLAAQAGDGAIAFQAIEDLAKDFGYSAADALKMKIQALNIASKSIISPD